MRKVAKHELYFDICTFHPQLPAAIQLVGQVPEMSFVLDHIGKPNIKDKLQEPWKAQLRELAALPNVVCKVSGMVTEADWTTWKAEDLRPYLEHVIACFGFDRLMFGSDWPVSTLASSYQRWLEVVQEAVKGASAAEQRQLFWDTATRFYRL